MNDDADTARIDRILRSLDAIDAMISLATDPTAGRVEGTDSTGTVCVTLDPTGVVDGVDLRSGWRREVGIAKLDAAVQDAARAATSARSTATSQHFAEIGFPDRLDQLDKWVDGVVDEAPPDVPATPSPLPTATPPGSTTRTILESIAETEQRLRTAPERPAETVGAAEFGKVTVTFTADGSFRSALDQDWLSRRDDTEIAAALNRAIAAARVELAASQGRARY